ncbi:MAG: hypothetical protein ACM30H_10605 [Clostridia bacterium]
MRNAPATDVEKLLKPESRAGLPLRRQLLIYLHPFALFKDASRGTVLQRELALAYNRAMRWMLLPYLRRWSAIAACLFVAVDPVEALAAQVSIFIYPAAAFAVGACLSVSVAACTAAGYLLLSRGVH